VPARLSRRTWGPHSWTYVGDVAGNPAPRLAVMPGPVLWFGGLGNPLERELRKTQYQFRRPFVLDSSPTVKTFGIDPVPLDEALLERVAALRGARPVRTCLTAETVRRGVPQRCVHLL
jgi:hypothetical protein